MIGIFETLGTGISINPDMKSQRYFTCPTKKKKENKTHPNDSPLLLVRQILQILQLRSQYSRTP